MLKTAQKIPPVIKWSGSKRNVAYKIGKFIPSAKRYFEPFVGGGALLPFRKIQNGIAGDIIPELIALWNAIKLNPEKTANEYKKRWEKLRENGCTVYYDIRDNFNATRNEYDFLFLTRTCVNGLIRYNDKGEFNNSFHLTRPGIHPDRLSNIIKEWRFIIKDIDFYTCDYREVIEMAREDDFFFLDPPYGGTKGRYTKEKFDTHDFYVNLDKLNTAGAKWILTFDGSAGSRTYSYEVPGEIYTHKETIITGLSPFTKMMNTGIDVVEESVYFNFNPDISLTTKSRKQINNESTLFNGLDVQN
ncbi:MAG: DNA adenine methylase [Treponema sp.]|jgi:DNA adenine methylase|nr:DNA adenine methylase [Treponema sp.]